ncbi:MAG: hypothetical protein L3J86_00750, partial [Thermoplasmata archaeon]|nr:hypothetical protein [Thermoplasmata archaeon]
MTTRRRRRPRAAFPKIPPRTGKEPHPAPRGFRPKRDAPAGRSPLLEVFAGLEKTVPFRKYPGDDAATLRIARQTWAHVTDGPGWMYVAPRRTPPEVRAAGFRMVESQDDEIVVASSYLANGPTMDLYLDIIHEFLHILQRRLSVGEVTHKCLLDALQVSDGRDVESNVELRGRSG